MIDPEDDRLSHEITLEVAGESIPVQLEEPGPVTKLNLVSLNNGFDSIGFVDDGGGLDKEVIRIVETVSDFPVELLNDLPMDQFNQLVQSSAAVLGGKEPTIDNKHPDVADSPFEEHDDDRGHPFR